MTTDEEPYKDVVTGGEEDMLFAEHAIVLNLSDVGQI